MRRLLLVAVLSVGCSNGRDAGVGGGGGGGGNGGGGSGGVGGPPETHDVVDPSLPPGIVAGFDGAQAQPGGLTVAYPSPGAILPHDLAPIDVQWNPPTGANVYRVSFEVETGDKLRGYVKTADWIASTSDWHWLLDRAAGHKVNVIVEGGILDGAGQLASVVASSPVGLGVSRDDATGALFYFATTGDQLTGDGTLERLELGAQKADKYLNKSNDGGRCVGCHTLTRDGSKVAFAFFDIGIGPGGTSQTLGLVNATDPTKQLSGPAQYIAQATFSPDGSRMVTAFAGKLTLRDGTTGAQIADIPTSGPALYPDWSPDGSKLVFVRPAALCQEQIINIGQTSIFVYGGSLMTLDWQNGTFANEQVILASKGDNNYYPSWSPDGGYIAFTRADATVKSSWGMASLACGGKDGSGLSYDNPSATLWLLPANGGAPIELTAATGEPMHTNSWPKWGPKSDGCRSARRGRTATC
jgi:dipeptidyl aminopeptidase/acylaminoacyl peptidase